MDVTDPTFNIDKHLATDRSSVRQQAAGVYGQPEASRNQRFKNAAGQVAQNLQQDKRNKAVTAVNIAGGIAMLAAPPLAVGIAPALAAVNLGNQAYEAKLDHEEGKFSGANAAHNVAQTGTILYILN